MSDALNFLLKARPEAMAHYFSFLKDCGKHLDPKTRDLISLITKVHAQTERGFRQYLKRALRDGCTPAEVLDALLMAFPALGLAKIVWAVDIILALQLPGFDPAALGQPAAATAAGTAQGAWHDVMAIADLACGGTARVECSGRDLFVHHGAGGWKVFDSLCPHQATNIPQLALSGATLVCPKHGWSFDIRTGQCTARGDAPLKQWDSKVENGRLLARW